MSSIEVFHPVYGDQRREWIERRGRENGMSSDLLNEHREAEFDEIQAMLQRGQTFEGLRRLSDVTLYDLQQTLFRPEAPDVAERAQTSFNRFREIITANS